MKRIWTEEQLSDFIELYNNQGWTLVQIGKKYGTKADTISKKLKEKGVSIKKNSTKNRLLKHDYFTSIDSEEKAYFLGLLFADGNINIDKQKERSPQIRLELVETDREVLEFFKKEINSNATLSYNKRANRENGTFTLSIRSQQMADDLKKFNIVPNKTYEVNEIIIPLNYEIPFLRGYIDGDGSIYCQKNNQWHVNICGHSLHIISQLAALGNKLIGKEGSGYISCYNNVYRHIWSEKDTKKLLEILYRNASVSIARKQSKAIDCLEDKKS